MNDSCRFSCFILLLPVHRCGRDCREIITEAACTSTRLWRPIMPRGAPRGHGIFCQSVEGSEKTASVFRCSLFFYSSTLVFLDQRHHCLAVVVTRGVEAIPSPFERHAASQIARRPATDRSSTSMSSMYRLLSSSSPG